MIKKALLTSLTIIIIICVLGGLWLYSAVNKDIEEHFAGSCSEIPLDGSAEDIQIDRARGLAYLSIFDRMATAKGDAATPGTIARLDLNMNPPQVASALTNGPDLHPHGLSLFIDATGQRHLFIINHPEDRSTGDEAIEHYVEFTPGVYSHMETFRSPLITRANDMVAVGPQQFYVAQDVDRSSGETLTELVYFDGENFSVVADDIQSGGGINVSADNNTLYIAETGGKAVRVARRNPADGSIETIRSISLGTSPDNIDVAEDGSIWVGGHSNVVALAMHFIVGSDAPSQILRVDVTSDDPQIDEIYLNAGSQISAGSGGATIGNRLLIGSITSKKLLICEMEGP
jgi:arylesterase/paraoxonase